MQPKKILLVDDSKTTLRMEKMILRAEPCELVVAKDGREAVDSVVEERPDLILLDVVMPVMDASRLAGGCVRTRPPVRRRSSW